MWSWPIRRVIATHQTAQARRSRDLLDLGSMVRAAMWADKEGWAKVTKGG